MTGLIRENLVLWIYCCVVAACLGAVVGSFLHCAAWRMVRGESFLTGRSRCPQCGHVLGPGDLVPVFSWLFLRGRCRYCGERIPARYALSELFCAAVSVLCFLRFGATAECLRNWIFLCCLFCLSLTDLDGRVIPDGCLLISAGVWAVSLPFTGIQEALPGLLTALGFGGGLLALSLGMDRILGKESLGGGDIKLLAAAGLYLGPVRSLFALLLACVLGLVPAVRAGRGNPFPFGPAIAASTAAMLLYGEGLAAWYLGLMGFSSI